MDVLMPSVHALLPSMYVLTASVHVLFGSWNLVLSFVLYPGTKCPLLLDRNN